MSLADHQRSPGDVDSAKVLSAPFFPAPTEERFAASRSQLKAVLRGSASITAGLGPAGLVLATPVVLLASLGAASSLCGCAGRPSSWAKGFLVPAPPCPRPGKKLEMGFFGGFAFGNGVPL